MVRNYAKVAWRHMMSHKSFSVINVTGMAASLSVCLLIILFIYDQKSYDRFHPDSGRIYRVITEFKSGSSGNQDWFATSPANMAEILATEVPGVEVSTHLLGSFRGEARINHDLAVPLEGLFVDADFFEVFGFELLQGDPADVFSKPGSVVLASSMAEAYFKGENPVGKVISRIGDGDYVVTGVVDDRVRSHMAFNALASARSLADQAPRRDWMTDYWYSYTYLRLEGQADVGQVQSRLQGLMAKHYPPVRENTLEGVMLQPLTSINLGMELANEIGTVLPDFVVYFLAGFAVVIIVIACFNYISLTVARSLNRGKEVGLRKVMGAHRGHILRQFVVEAVVIAAIALVFAVVGLFWLLPEFNSLSFIHISQSQIHVDLMGEWQVYLIFVVFCVFIGLVAGIYPALYLSRFEPASVLKGLSKAVSTTLLRKTIVVAQFAVTIIFVISSLLLHRQFRHMADTDYGFDHEHIVHVALQDVPYERLRGAMISASGVADVAATSKVPALGSTSGRYVSSQSVTEPVGINMLMVDEAYLGTMGLNLLAGRNFDPAADRKSAVILNESAARALGWSDALSAVGGAIYVSKEAFDVVGVVNSFLTTSPLETDEPALLFYEPDGYVYAAVKTRPGEMAAFLEGMKPVWEAMGSEYPLRFRVFDEELKNNFIVVIFGDFTKVMAAFSIFAVLISCLGLLGMAMYTTERRLKEVCIRKVLGASSRQVSVLLSRDYLVLMVIATALGAPAAWFLNGLWLQLIGNRITINPWLVGGVAVAMIVLALLTIASQTLRAANANAVEHLRNE